MPMLASFSFYITVIQHCPYRFFSVSAHNPLLTIRVLSASYSYSTHFIRPMVYYEYLKLNYIYIQIFEFIKL